MPRFIVPIAIALAYRSINISDVNRAVNLSYLNKPETTRDTISCLRNESPGLWHRPAPVSYCLWKQVARVVDRKVRLFISVAQSSAPTRSSFGITQASVSVQTWENYGSTYVCKYSKIQVVHFKQFNHLQSTKLVDWKIWRNEKEEETHEYRTVQESTKSTEEFLSFFLSLFDTLGIFAFAFRIK